MNEVFIIDDVPQVLKEEVQERIEEAAERVFARHGYRGAKMSEIAAEAGLSTGNLYRYFGSKEALFETVIDEGFVETFERLLDERVRALASTELTAPGSEARDAAETMLRFWMAHRLRVVILLDRAEGSAHADFGDAFVERLVGQTTKELRRELGKRRLPLVVHSTLEDVFQSSRRAVVSILETYERETEIRTAFAAFWAFQLAGLEGFRRWVTR